MINIAVLSNIIVAVISDFNIAPRINFLKKEVQDSIKCSNCTWPTLKTSSQLTDKNISTDFWSFWCWDWDKHAMNDTLSKLNSQYHIYWICFYFVVDEEYIFSIFAVYLQMKNIFSSYQNRGLMNQSKFALCKNFLQTLKTSSQLTYKTFTTLLWIWTGRDSHVLKTKLISKFSLFWFSLSSVSLTDQKRALLSLNVFNLSLPFCRSSQKFYLL